jgi:ABC-2 type transport system permease protein
LNPVTYAVDGMRGAMLGMSTYPVVMDFSVLFGFAIGMIVIGSIAFSRMK